MSNFSNRPYLFQIYRTLTGVFPRHRLQTPYFQMDFRSRKSWKMRILDNIFSEYA